jgi:hypothetical protein
MVEVKVLSRRHGTQIALIDDEDQSEVMKHTYWLHPDGYAISKCKGKNIRMHRLVMKVANSKVLIDHINLNKLDNRKCNLRVCTNSQNKMNCLKRQDNTSGYKGVWFKKTGKRIKRWVAEIRKDDKKINLGLFFTKEEAANAYDIAAIKYFGEFANTNFPREKYTK